MIEDSWVTVEQAQLEAVAEMMRGRLEAEGIEAVLRGNRVAGAAGIVNEFNISWNNPLGGVEVRVRPADVQRAREILTVDERSSADKETKQRDHTATWIQVLGMAISVAGIAYVVAGLLTGDRIIAAAIAMITFVCCGLIFGVMLRK